VDIQVKGNARGTAFSMDMYINGCSEGLEQRVEQGIVSSANTGEHPEHSYHLCSSTNLVYSAAAPMDKCTLTWTCLSSLREPFSSNTPGIQTPSDLRTGFPLPCLRPIGTTARKIGLSMDSTPLESLCCTPSF